MTAPADQRKSLRTLRESTGTLFARNNTRNKITCNGDKVSFELDPGEIAVMPKEALNVPGFQRLWARNAVTVSDDESLEDELIFSGGNVERRNTVSVVMNDGTTKDVEPQLMEPPSRRDIVIPTHTDMAGRDMVGQTYGTPVAGANACLIPRCTNQVFIQQKFLEDGEPNLCNDHAELKGQVVSTPQPDGSWTHQLATVQPLQKSE